MLLRVLVLVLVVNNLRHRLQHVADPLRPADIARIKLPEF